MDRKRRKYLKFIGQLTLFSTVAPSIFVSCEEPTTKSEWYGELSGTEKRLKNALRKVLMQGTNINLKWECGGDQAILSFENNEEIKSQLNESILRDLQIYVMNFLELPDVGPFRLDGKGTLFLKDEDIFIECESLLTISKSELYYNPDETIPEEDTTFVDSDYSGIVKLFEKKKN